MRKALILLLFILSFNFTSVKDVNACSPVTYFPVTIIVDGANIDNPTLYNYDLLINANENSEHLNSEISKSYKDLYPYYDTYDYLENTEWVSYRAFYNGDETVFGAYIITFEDMNYNDIQEYKLIVFEDNGSVVFTSEVLNKSDVLYNNENGDSKVYRFFEDELTYEIDLIEDGCSGWNDPMNILMYLMLAVIVVFVVGGIATSTYVLTKRFRK